MTSLEELSSSLASDATQGEGVLPGYVTSLERGQRLVARARVATVGVDDNGAIRAILDRADRHDGEVLVVTGSWSSRTSVTGGITALALAQLGFAGLVTDGLVRDSAEIRASKLLVWCRGTSPIAPKYRLDAQRPTRVEFGRIGVSDGDLVVADDDGVVVWPAADVPVLLEAAIAKEASDAERLGTLLRG
jgi:4-hydroxy-4-methyl-2-oxoglutarate aldolase